MEFNKKRYHKYDRVMPRVYDRSRSILSSSSNVTRHQVLSSARGGAKQTNFHSSVFSDLPVVLNDYEPDKPAERTFVVKPRRTIKSLDPAKSPQQQAILKTQRSKSSHVRSQSSAPSVFARSADKWSDVHLRECYSSRSHSNLKELKNEIRTFHETEKYMKLRSRLYKRCGVILDDVGQVTVDKGVQAERGTDMVTSKIRYIRRPDPTEMLSVGSGRGERVLLQLQ